MDGNISKAIDHYFTIVRMTLIFLSGEVINKIVALLCLNDQN